MKIERIIMKWSPGIIYDIMDEACEIAKANDCIVQFPFNGVVVEVTKHADIETGAESVLNSIDTKGAVVRVGE